MLSSFWAGFTLKTLKTEHTGPRVFEKSSVQPTARHCAVFAALLWGNEVITGQKENESLAAFQIKGICLTDLCHGWRLHKSFVWSPAQPFWLTEY